jgi:hypothetical protein
MSNNKDLCCSRQPSETAPYLNGGAPTDSGIHFVEHQRASRFRPGNGNFEGKHDARKFAT